MEERNENTMAETMSDTRSDTRLDTRPDTSLDTLLEGYIDLLNQYGTVGQLVLDFEKEHQKNKELVKLMDAARQVRGLFDEGQLK